MKKYPLVIEPPLADSEGYWSKGHHKPAAFIRELNDWANDEGDFSRIDPFNQKDTDRAKHSYWRKGQDYIARSEGGWTVYEYDGPGRGRFPVTVLWSAYR